MKVGEDSKLYKGQQKKNKMLQRYANKEAQRMLMKDPNYRRQHKKVHSTNPEDVKARTSNQGKTTIPKLLDKTALLRPVDDIIDFT